MGRFVQTLPPPADPYGGDRLLRSWLERHLGEQGHAAARPRLEALAADVTGPLLQAHRDAEAHPPELVRYDPWGKRINHIQTSAGWQTLREAAARHGLVAEPYRPGGSRVLQHALLHLYGPESAVFSCPVAMSDGAAALISGLGEPNAWLDRLTSTDPAQAATSGQWMTESTGGSDLSGTGTVARRDADGWRVTGEKWFCSAIDSPIAIALARPEGADSGTRFLAPFLIERDQPGITVHRLKDKLGTRALPTAEVGLADVTAMALGDPAHGGLARMMTLVVVTRLHNAAAASSGMRRGLDYALAFAAARNVAGGRLAVSPLHRATLATLAVDTAGAFVLTGHAFSLMQQAQEAELRLVAPLAKLATGKLAVANASEYVECFGGAGYVEDTGIPRLLRDAQVLPIWEGTTNVLALDVVRAVVAGHAEAVLSRLDTHPSLAQTTASLRDEIALVRKDPASTAVVAGARGLALRLANALTAALLLEHADWGTEVAADLWRRRWLGHEDIAAAAADNFTDLCG
ncbi:acyl-CoA dehydrogenase [Rhizocola hellebori]|uniref:Acyl-CoA dehydrogenase n=1 Tax=Rhizocola hellebori TaxID=1392758 RepID=A0A8J3Q5I6_9ACTN|nr:acyl-CoA dehydrogenase family protein [Rhizocola hellebori]GIH04156.1 acyl-CoA dehydrogenase [Rhizocola hellebori]